jgi:hypothetical protein
MEIREGLREERGRKAATFMVRTIHMQDESHSVAARRAATASHPEQREEIRAPP